MLIIHLFQGSDKYDEALRDTQTFSAVDYVTAAYAFLRDSMRALTSFLTLSKEVLLYIPDYYIYDLSVDRSNVDHLRLLSLRSRKKVLSFGDGSPTRV